MNRADYNRLEERIATLERRVIELERDEHLSSCATNNGPALPAGPCDCKDSNARRRKATRRD